MGWEVSMLFSPKERGQGLLWIIVLIAGLLALAYFAWRMFVLILGGCFDDNPWTAC